MATLVVKTYDGRVYEDSQWETVELVGTVQRLIELRAEDAPSVMFFDQPDESVVIVKYADISELRVLGCGAVEDWD